MVEVQILHGAIICRPNTDGGIADIAGANICPPIHASHRHLGNYFSLPVIDAAPPSLAPCGIPYILYIKKTGAMHRY